MTQRLDGTEITVSDNGVGMTDGLTLYRGIYAAAGDAIHIGQM
ncbi:hypothetical protein [Paenibacillus sp. FSL H7-0331]|nr:hypothetical protein [Paenibacillus sp. FSL H7-0331]